MTDFLDIDKASAMSFDIETLGLEQNVVCLSIGIVRFNPFYREVVPAANDKLHLHFSLFDQIASNGRKVDMNTVDWWAGQSAAARQELYKSLESLETMQETLEKLRVWFLRRPVTHGFWSRGILDWNVIEHMKPGLIPYNEWRDQRTLCATMPTMHIPRPVVHTEHDAYEDALYQARYIAGIFTTLKEQSDERAKYETREALPTEDSLAPADEQTTNGGFKTLGEN